MLYVLPFRMKKPILSIPPATLTFHTEINHLSRKRTLNNSCIIRVLLSSKREKKRITKVKRVAMSTKQMK